MNRHRAAKIVIGAAAFAAVAGGMAAPAAAQRVIGRPVGPGGTVALPYSVADNAGNQWRFYPAYFQQSGNMPLYSQGAMLYVNGNQPPGNNRAAKMDDKTGELVIEGNNINGITVTRRVLFDKETNVVRYIDVVKNTGGQDAAVNLMIQSSVNYGINTAQTVADPKKKDQNIAWVAQTSGNGAVMEMYAGKNAKQAMTIQYQQGNNVVQANYQSTLKPNQEVALMHLHGTMPSQDAASQYVTKLKEADLLKKVPTNIRKLIVNFAVGGGMIGDLEVLRGDALDVVELRSGDQLKGTLKEEKFDLTTFYGPVSLPVDKVIAVMNVGAFRPRQLVVTVDGQVFGGSLKQEALSLQLSSGQVTKIPLAQVNRAGYRKRPGEPEEWTFDKPLALMRSGERIGVKPPAQPLEAATRYGKVTLKPAQLTAVVLQTEEAGLHQFVLSDGSRFSGLLAADALDMILDTGGGGPDQAVKFPVSSVSRLQLSGKTPEAEDGSATVKLANDDLLVGQVGGELKVDTSFDTLTVNASEVRELRHVPGGGADVQVVLFDGSTVSGQLQQMELPVKTAGGLDMKVPLALLEEYLQPQPAPNKETEAKIAALVKDLSNEDFKARDRAQQGLTGLGPSAIGPLKKVRDAQPDEAKQRIDTIVKELEKAGDKGGTSKPSTKKAAAPAAGAVLNKDDAAPAPVPPGIILNKDFNR